MVGVSRLLPPLAAITASAATLSARTATATATATAAATATATTEASSTAWRAFGGFVYPQHSPIELTAVHLLDGTLASGALGKRDEAKASRAAGVAIVNHGNVIDLPEALESTSKACGVCTETEPTDK